MAHMQPTEHDLALPWKQEGGGSIPLIVDARNDVIGKAWDQKGRFLVRAANNHHALLGTLKSLATAVHSGDWTESDVAAAYVAIAAAEPDNAKF